MLKRFKSLFSADTVSVSGYFAVEGASLTRARDFGHADLQERKRRMAMVGRW